LATSTITGWWKLWMTSSGGAKNTLTGYTL
jgi:hypothetical protein